MAKNKIDYRDFESIIHEIDERKNDYFGEGTFFMFKNRLDEYFQHFDSQHHKNLSHLRNDAMGHYLAHLKHELSRVQNFFTSREEDVNSYFGKYRITGEELFSRAKRENELTEILSNNKQALKIIAKDNDKLTKWYGADSSKEKENFYDNAINVIRDFYYHYSFLYVCQLENIIGENTEPAKVEVFVKKISVKKAVNKKIEVLGFRKEHIDFLKGIYNLPLDRGDFIDKDKTSEEEFINILTSKEPVSEEGAIHFDCETTQAAYILEKMKQVSRKFTFAAIENSEKFFSKNGTIMTASNLSKPRNTTREPKEFEAINSYFSKILPKQ